MYSLRSVDVVSCAKITGAVYGSLALIMLPFLRVAGLGSLFAGNTFGPLSVIAMICYAVLAPFIYGLLGFAIGAFTAWVYNFFAKRIGGIRLELKFEAVPAPPSNLGLI
jgi:hypothetical protein